MTVNNIPNYVECEYLNMCARILENGVLSTNRTINATKKLFGSQLKFDLSHDQIPLLTSKYVNFQAVVAELEWFCKGNTNNNVLKKLGTGIWNQWASDSGSLGPIYGAMWRRRPVSAGALDQFNMVEDLQSRYKRTDDIVEVEQWAIDEVIALNKNWVEMKEKYPGEFHAWTNMLCNCASRFICSTGEPAGEISVTNEMRATREEREQWVTNLLEETIWKEIGTDTFAVMQPSDIYRPWLSFENFLMDTSSIPYTESRKSNNIRLTSYFHGVKFYSPWSTVFYVPVLQYIAKNFMQTSTHFELSCKRPKVFIDQLQDIIDTLKTNPFSRRMVVNSWEPSFIPNEATDPRDNPKEGLQALTPCHHDWQVCVRNITVGDLILLLPSAIKWIHDDHLDDTYGEIFDNLFNVVSAERQKQSLEPLQKLTLDLRFSMRSTDVFLGLPFNIASYAVLARVIAKIVGMNAGTLVYQGTDVHLYENTFDQMKEQCEREPLNFPILKVGDIKSIDDFTADKLTLLNYEHLGAIKANVSV